MLGAPGRGSLSLITVQLQPAEARPLLQALRHPSGKRAVLLIDEIDRADAAFEAFLLELLSDWQITIPELGTIKAHQPPLTILTANGTREIHDALKRRCFYAFVDYPSRTLELDILRTRLPEVPARRPPPTSPRHAALASTRARRRQPTSPRRTQTSPRCRRATRGSFLVPVAARPSRGRRGLSRGRRPWFCLSSAACDRTPKAVLTSCCVYARYVGASPQRKEA